VSLLKTLRGERAQAGDSNTFDPEIPPGACPHSFVRESGVERCIHCSASLRTDRPHRPTFGKTVWYRVALGALLVILAALAFWAPRAGP